MKSSYAYILIISIGSCEISKKKNERNDRQFNGKTDIKVISNRLVHYRGATKNRAKKFPVKTNEEEKTATYKKQIIHMHNYEFDTKIPIEKKQKQK